MASITLLERELVARQNKLHAIFDPLRAGASRLAFRFAGDSPGGTKALVATDQKIGTPRYQDAMFRTSVSILRCRYFELWRFVRGRTLVLDRAYFTLLRVEEASRKLIELLCLHADPDDTEEFKQGPHLHVSCAEDPIPHCHFPLDLASLNVVLKDCEALTSAMQRAIGAIAIEVLREFKQY